MAKPTPKQMYERYIAFLNEMSVDLDQKVERPDFDEFNRKWQKVCQDPGLKKRWIAKYWEGTFEDAKADVDKFLEEISGPHS